MIWKLADQQLNESKLNAGQRRRKRWNKHFKAKVAEPNEPTYEQASEQLIHHSTTKRMLDVGWNLDTPLDTMRTATSHQQTQVLGLQGGQGENRETQMETRRKGIAGYKCVIL